MKELETLKKTVADQENQIKSLRHALNTLMQRLQDTDKRARRNSENLRRNGNDINNIKRKLGSR